VSVPVWAAAEGCRRDDYGNDDDDNVRCRAFVRRCNKARYACSFVRARMHTHTQARPSNVCVLLLLASSTPRTTPLDCCMPAPALLLSALSALAPALEPARQLYLQRCSVAGSALGTLLRTAHALWPGRFAGAEMPQCQWSPGRGCLQGNTPQLLGAAALPVLQHRRDIGVTSKALLQRRGTTVRQARDASRRNATGVVTISEVYVRSFAD
jgi:hypothetical protein